MLRASRYLFSKNITQPRFQPTTRLIHTSPKEYNGLQSAAGHFKRQRHMPYFLEYLMWVVFGSEALHLIWLKMDYKEYKERTSHKTKLLEELISRIEQGEEITDSLRQEIKMVLMNDKAKVTQGQHDDIDDEYLNKLIASSETEQVKKVTVEDKAIEDSNWMKTEDSKGQKKPFFL